MAIKQSPVARRDAGRKLAALEAEGHRIIGRFLAAFAQLEFTIRFVLANQLRLPEEYFDIVTSPYDFAMLCTVTREIACIRNPADADAIKHLFNECHSLNTDRVRVAHGLWSFGENGPVARHVPRASLTAKYYYEREGELNQLTDKAQELFQAVLTLGRGQPKA